MTYERGAGAGAPGGDGCLVAAVRVPVRVVAFVVVLPLRLLWDALCAVARGIGIALEWIWRNVLAPPLNLLGRGLAALWRYVLAPVGRVLFVVPAVWIWHYLISPVLAAVAVAVVFLVRYLLVWPAVALWRYVLAPVGRAVGWVLRILLVVPLVFLWQQLVMPVARAIGAAVAWAWHAAGYVSRAIGSGVAWTFRVLIAIPVAWVWRWTGAPVLRGLRAAGRWARREILHPVAQAVREARRGVRTALFGAPAPRERLPPARRRIRRPAGLPAGGGPLVPPPGPAGPEPVRAAAGPEPVRRAAWRERTRARTVRGRTVRGRTVRTWPEQARAGRSGPEPVRPPAAGGLTPAGGQPGLSTGGAAPAPTMRDAA